MAKEIFLSRMMCIRVNREIAVYALLCVSVETRRGPFFFFVLRFPLPSDLLSSLRNFSRNTC